MINYTSQYFLIMKNSIKINMLVTLFKIIFKINYHEFVTKDNGFSNETLN